MVVGVLACPNLPQDPLLAVENKTSRQKHGGYSVYLEAKTPKTPECVLKPPLKSNMLDDGIGCLFVAAHGSGAHQAALFGKATTAGRHSSPKT